VEDAKVEDAEVEDAEVEDAEMEDVAWPLHAEKQPTSYT
jgi:hypothetical protein